MPDPKPSTNDPYVMKLEAGEYIWCGCGLSKDDPFCDNSHKGTEFENSDRAALLFEIEKDEKVALCGCKKTINPPYCDGSHKARS